MHFLSEETLLTFLIQLLLLLGCAKALGALFEKWGQPTLTADLIVGIIIGPTVLGRLWPQGWQFIFPPNEISWTMLETVSWIGILLMLLVTGLEINFNSVWRQRGEAFKIAFLDLIIPIALSVIVFSFLPDEVFASANLTLPISFDQKILAIFFLASIMTISALPVSIRAMQESGILKSDLGFLTVSALSINDIFGWVVFTIILGIFAHGSIDLSFIFSTIGLTILFTALALIFGRKIMDRIFFAVHRKSEWNSSGFSLTILVLLGILFGILTMKIGIHALFGFFLAGLIAGESRFLKEKERGSILQTVYAIFIPLFFVNIGLKIDMAQSFDLTLVLIFTFLGFGSRFFGAWLGALSSGYKGNEKNIIAVLHTPGGEMHLVIGVIALEAGLISSSVFVAIVIAAVASSVSVGPLLSLLIKTKKEQPLSDAIEIMVFHDQLKQHNKQMTIDQLTKFAAVSRKANKDLIYRAVIERENAMSTGLGLHLAVPHCQIESWKKPLVILYRSEYPIEWDSPDGLPVDVVTLIVTGPGEGSLHLKFLQKLTKAWKERDLYHVLRSEPDKNLLSVFKSALNVH